MTTAMRTRHSPRFLDALAPYLGGKRKLLGAIAKVLPPPSEAPVLLDAFLGGGSVSLWAKRRGYRVIANDVAERSVVVGKALIENDRRPLYHDDVTRLFTKRFAEPGFVERTFAGEVIPTVHARFLDLVFAAARGLNETRSALLRLLAVKYVLSLRPMGNFGAKTVMRQMEARQWEEMNPSVLRDCFTSRIQSHPRVLAEELRRKINRGIFANGQVNEVRQGDVFDFLAGVEGDVAYLDPPYGGTQAYETALQPLDSMLAGRLVQPTPSAFSGRRATEVLNDLIAECRRIPRLVLSYGNAAMSPEAVAELVRRHRHDVQLHVIRHTHLAAIANADTKARNLEILIAAGDSR